MMLHPTGNLRPAGYKRKAYDCCAVVNQESIGQCSFLHSILAVTESLASCVGTRILFGWISRHPAADLITEPFMATALIEMKLFDESYSERCSHFN